MRMANFRAFLCLPTSIRQRACCTSIHERLTGSSSSRTTDFIRGHSKRLAQSAALNQARGAQYNSGCALGGVQRSSLDEVCEGLGFAVAKVLMQIAVEIPFPTSGRARFFG